MMNRRTFLKRIGLLTAASMVPFSLSGSSWAALSANDDPHKPRLITIFLRGAVDGLSVVVPYADPYYYQVRPRIAIPRPDQPKGALDLEGHFGLHPTLAPILPMWKDGSLAFIQASGSPDPSLSHFDAQEYMESGTPGIKITPDGWMNRLLQVLPNEHAPTQAISLGSSIPRILTGPRSVANLELGHNADRSLPIDHNEVQSVFSTFYGGNDELSSNYQEGIHARKELMDWLAREQKIAYNGAPLAKGFPSEASQLSRLIANDPHVEIAFLALGGWDTHIQQGSSVGPLATELTKLGQGLATLVEGLGDRYHNTVIVIMSEFGRTVHENGDAGTDHGHGNVMWVMGGPVRGGKVYGRWPGLSPEQLNRNRDLAVTTDFRDVLASVLQPHFQLTDAQVAHIFPHYALKKTNQLPLIV